MTDPIKPEAVEAVKTPTREPAAELPDLEDVADFLPLAAAAVTAKIGVLARVVGDAQAKEERGEAYRDEAGAAVHHAWLGHARSALTKLHRAEAGLNQAAQALSEHEIHAEHARSVKS